MLMSTSFKLMDTSKKGKRIRRLTGDTSNAWHVTLNGLIDLVKSLLGLGIKYICLGKMQNDRLEGEFGVIRQMSSGCYLISVDLVISSLSLRRLKLYSKLGLENVVDTNKNECCEGNLDVCNLYFIVLNKHMETKQYIYIYEKVN